MEKEFDKLLIKEIIQIAEDKQSYNPEVAEKLQILKRIKIQ